MSAVNDGGPAFPMAFQSLDRQGNPDSSPNVEWGMTLRDYFAAKALAGMCADSEISGSAEAYAESAYKFADAMLAARANGGGKGAA